ncbi:MAG: PmoA family protein [Chthoniobacter sp.]|nr:PmoA family protein [Chthoniobacter sp.]
MKTHLALLTLLAVLSSARGDWAVKDDANTDLPGRRVDITQDGVLRARLIYGEGQMKPYLRVQGEEGDGLNEWSETQRYPHHRGIFIGWNKITSDLGSFDLWHFNNGGRMALVKLTKLEGGKDSATIVATIEWRGGAKDATGGDLLLTETRTLTVSRPAAKTTQVDAQFVLQAARDLSLGGDLQHAGVHFRASASVVPRAGETAYVWEPDLAGKDGKVASKDLKWARYTFPIGTRWYHATELNAPTNPVEELSWRDYGRFGFFFKKELKKDETLAIKYRFFTELAEGVTAKPTDEQRAVWRKGAQAQYEAFAK